MATTIQVNTSVDVVNFEATIIQAASEKRVKSNGKLFCYVGFETTHNGKALKGLAMYTFKDENDVAPKVGEQVTIFMDKAPEGAPFKYSFSVGKSAIELSSDNDWDNIFG